MGLWDLQTIEVGSSRIDLKAFSGTVVAHRTWSETHVSSSSGGGLLVEGTGFMPSSRVSSRVTRRDELFIRNIEGSERSLQLTNADIGVRVGSRVSSVLGTRRGRNESWDVGILNHDTLRWTPFEDGIAKLAPGAPFGKPLLLAGAAVAFEPIRWLKPFIALVMLAAYVWYLVGKARTKRAWQHQLSTAVASLEAGSKAPTT